jgi:regulator of nucleoside diphosphate kinase
MKSHSIVVSDADMDRLSRLVMALKHFLFRDQLQLESLNQTLESAEVASSERIPRDIIRMNSRIHVLDLDTGKNELYTLVFPENADISTGLISVLAPVGIALLGRRQRDIIEARVPGGGSGGYESSACCTEQVGNESGHIKQKSILELGTFKRQGWLRNSVRNISQSSIAYVHASGH